MATFGSLPVIDAPDLASISPIDNAGLIAAPVHRGFFDKGGTGRTILGIIGDALASATGGHPVFAELQRQQHEDQRAQGLALLQNQLTIQRQNAAQAYKDAHPEPTNTERTFNYFKSIGRDDLANMYIQNQAQGAPVAVDMTDGNGNTYRTYQRPGAMSAPQGGTLPPGYTVRKGGAAPQGAGGFR